MTNPNESNDMREALQRYVDDERDYVEDIIRYPKGQFLDAEIIDRHQKAVAALAQASIATPNPPFSEVKALNNSLWMPNAELEKVNSEHDKWFIEFYTEGHKLREHDFYLPSLWAWQRQHLNKTQASIATPQPQTVREHELLEKAAEAAEEELRGLGLNHDTVIIVITEAIRALIEPLSAADDGHDEEYFYQVIGWMRGHHFIGLPENARPGDKPVYERHVRRIAPLSAATGGQESESVAEVAEVNGCPIVYWDKSLPVGTKLFLAPPSALAIDTAAKMQAAEVCEQYKELSPLAARIHSGILATIHQDGITELGRLLEKAVIKGAEYGYNSQELCTFMNDDIRAIVNSLIGEK